LLRSTGAIDQVDGTLRLSATVFGNNDGIQGSAVRLWKADAGIDDCDFMVAQCSHVDSAFDVLTGQLCYLRRSRLIRQLQRQHIALSLHNEPG